jgi:hypothetical protein
MAKEKGETKAMAKEKGDKTMAKEKGQNQKQ